MKLIIAIVKPNMLEAIEHQHTNQGV